MTVCARLVPVLLGFAFFSAPLAAQSDDHKPAQVVELVITASGSEDPLPQNPLGPSRRNFRGKLQQIRDMAADENVAGVRLVVKGIPGLAKSIDLLAELSALKAAGKTIVCYTETLDRNGLLFCSLADQLVMPPSGMIILEGMVAEMMYYKELLDTLDVSLEVLHIGDYKTAYENFALNAMSDGQREVIKVILDEHFSQLIASVADHRGLAEEQVLAFFDQLIVDPSAAAQGGLIDAAVYEDEFDDVMDVLFGSDHEMVEHYGDRTQEDIEAMLENPFAIFSLLPQLLNPPAIKMPEEAYVGVVYASGAIISGKSQVDFEGNVSSMGSETIVAALQKVGEDDNCKAVVLRVNSPGGSAMASDMIWQAIERVKENKPVISSMGSVAASGGYWISMGCDAIVAQPSTITGSIGVVSMLPDVSRALKSLGVSVQTVAVGPRGDEMSLLAHGPSEGLKSTMTHWMELTYDEFISKVSNGRNIPADRVQELAQGRVWTGRQAEQNGLVDTLGGLTESIELACVMAGLDVEGTPLVELPEAPNIMEQIEESMGNMVSVHSAEERLLIALGLSEVLDMAEQLASHPRALHSDSVQAILPWRLLLR
ncbi:MAG: protease-4 [Pseudohongiellaceae bacterium]|jgi:protease-4